MEQENSSRNNVSIYIAVIAIAVAAYFIYQSVIGGGKYEIPFPVTRSVVSNTTFTCEALVDGSVTGSPVEFLTNGIEATIGRGTNNISFQIKDEKTLSFLSGASFTTGDVGGVDFSIVKNDANELVAAMWNGVSMNTVVLNKINGLAIWSKSRSDFPGYDAPAVDVSYLVCK